MQGSVAAGFAFACLGIVVAVISFAIREVNKSSKKVEGVEVLRAGTAKLEADVARLEGENVRLRAENATLTELATGRKDIEDLIQEIRTMVWVLAGPNAGQFQQGGRNHGHTEPDPPVGAAPAAG